MSHTVLLGIDILKSQQFASLENKRVGLYTNASGVDSQLQSTYQLLLRARNVNLVALFAPEHGIFASEPDGKPIESMTDPSTHIAIHSLYGDNYEPTESMMAQVDIIVVDIQDIGVRYYTFMWTLTYLIEACGKYNVEMLILDRPNPLGGKPLGAVLDSQYSSIVGRFPVPIVHGLTIGEMAALFNRQWNPHPSNLSIIKSKGWTRNMQWSDTGLRWVAPSPNMPTLSTVLHYSGSCLLEGTNLSEGRGTTLPFEIVGAPWIDSQALANKTNQRILRDPRYGIARPHTFIPYNSKYQHQVCHGIQVYPHHPRTFNAIETWLIVLDTIRELHPDHFAWLEPEDPTAMYHFDRLIGIANFRDNNDFVRTIRQHSDISSFTSQSHNLTLYEVKDTV